MIMMNGKAKQSGFSLISFIFVIAVIACVVLIAFKTVPIFTEYTTVRNGLTKSLTAGSEVEIKKAFQNTLIAGYGGSFQVEDLIFQNVNGRMAVGFAYERKIHLVGPVSLLFEFSNNQYVP